MKCLTHILYTLHDAHMNFAALIESLVYIFFLFGIHFISNCCVFHIFEVFSINDGEKCLIERSDTKNVY